MPFLVWSWSDLNADPDNGHPTFHLIVADQAAAEEWIANRDWTIYQRHDKGRPAVTWGEHRRKMHAIITGRASTMTMMTFDDPGPFVKGDDDIYIPAYPARTFYFVQCDGFHVATFSTREEAQSFIDDRVQHIRSRSGPYFIDAVEGG